MQMSVVLLLCISHCIYWSSGQSESSDVWEISGSSLGNASADSSSNTEPAHCDCCPMDVSRTAEKLHMHTPESGHEHKSGHGHEHEGADSSVERTMSFMTLGSVAFQMSLFYIVNHRDDDIKRYSLSVIGQTISIFCSVLFFSAIWGLIEESLDHTSDLTQTLACPVLCVLFFLAMEVMVLMGARVRGDAAEQKATVTYSSHSIMELEMPDHELNAKTIGAGAAVMCAAAAIRSFGSLQYWAYSSQHSMLLVFMVCPIAFCSQFVIVYLASHIRTAVILFDDHVDETEATWVRVAEECEDEVIALSCGFHFAAALRILITDNVPHVLLEEGAGGHHESLNIPTRNQIALLWAIGIACALLCIGLNISFFGLLDHGIDPQKLRSEAVSRIVRVFTQSIGMMFAWLMCFATHFSALLWSHEGLQLQLVTALGQSMVCFFIVLVLDALSDMECSGPAFDKAIIMIIFALGTSVGLTWEHAFEKCAKIAVGSMAGDKSTPLFQASNDPKIWALVLSGCILLTVLPAYRFYIVPRMYQMIEEHEHSLKREESEYRRKSILAGGIGETIFEWHGDSQLELEMNDHVAE